MRAFVALTVLALSLGAVVACGEDDGGGGSGGAGAGAAPGGGGSSGSAGAGGTVTAGAGGTTTAGAGGSAGVDASAGAGGVAGSAGAPTDSGTDGGVPLPGLGAITGDCGPIDAVELTSPSPFTFDTVLDFGTTPYSYAALSTGGKKIYDDGNLGGSSIYSEIFSYEVLYRCELATLLKTETEIGYSDASGKRTDLLVQIDGYKVGVSVTRAFAYPPGTPLSVTDAQTLLDKKLSDIIASTSAVDPTDAWTKQILHVLAYDTQARDAVMQAYALIPAATRSDTIVMVTVTDGSDAFMY